MTVQSPLTGTVHGVDLSLVTVYRPPNVALHTVCIVQIVSTCMINAGFVPYHLGKLKVPHDSTGSSKALDTEAYTSLLLGLIETTELRECV